MKNQNSFFIFAYVDMIQNVKFVFVMISLMVSSLSVIAQATEKTVTLIVSGEGATKEEAIQQALFSAVEQSYRTFVSDNTGVLNDDLIRDEIVSVSSGNISNFKELDSFENKDGSYYSTVKATVSIDNLINYARSNGLSVDIQTGAFAMGMKTKQLNRENEVQAIKDLQTKLRKMGLEYNYFDYKLDLSEPYAKDDYFAIKATITITPNNNLARFRNLIISTLKSLSLSEEEQAEYERANIPFKRFAITEYNSDEDFISSIQKSVVSRKKDNIRASIIALRNTDEDYPLMYFPVLLLNNELKCFLQDNTGNYFGIIYTLDNSNGERYSMQDIAHVSSPEWPVYDFDPKYRNSNVEYYVYKLGSTIGGANLIQSKVLNLNQNFDFSFSDSRDPIGNPMLSGPAVLIYEMIFPEDHFSKIDDIFIKYRRPQYQE